MGFRDYDFFGLSRCLQVLDELRRLTAAPKNSHARKLWTLARGTDKIGRIKAGEGIRGDALGFIMATGSMKAIEFEPKGPYYKFELLKEETMNSYGEPSARIIGIKVYWVERKKCSRSYVEKETGCIKTRNSMRTEKTEVAQIKTRVTKWFFEKAKAVSALTAVAREGAFEKFQVPKVTEGERIVKSAEKDQANAESLFRKILLKFVRHKVANRWLHAIKLRILGPIVWLLTDRTRIEALS
ncbi:MAG: hypothetical protein LW629_10190 [Burkholderiales bacterium]|nr:hypothetical protein [Burkholderiales bacterium]